MRRLVLLALAILALFPVGAQAASVISETVLVPLHYRELNSSTDKLGIYASIGGGTPQIFEFDTGGAGLYAAYATNSNSPWWGTDFSATGLFVTNSYDSGIVNLIAQLSFSNGIIPAFRVRAYGDNPYLQIGLTAADTASASSF